MLPRYLGVERTGELVQEGLQACGGSQELEGGIVSHKSEQMNPPSSSGKQSQ